MTDFASEYDEVIDQAARDHAGCDAATDWALGEIAGLKAADRDGYLAWLEGVALPGQVRRDVHQRRSTDKRAGVRAVRCEGEPEGEITATYTPAAAREADDAPQPAPAPRPQNPRRGPPPSASKSYNQMLTLTNFPVGGTAIALLTGKQLRGHISDYRERSRGIARTVAVMEAIEGKVKDDELVGKVVKEKFFAAVIRKVYGSNPRPAVAG